MGKNLSFRKGGEIFTKTFQRMINTGTTRGPTLLRLLLRTFASMWACAEEAIEKARNARAREYGNDQVHGTVAC